MTVIADVKTALLMRIFALSAKMVSFYIMQIVLMSVKQM
jgi:hypothetical protein